MRHTKFISAKNLKKIKEETHIFFNFENLKKKSSMITLFEFCPKNLSLYFFNFVHSKTFPKWYNTCVYVNWIERNVNFDVFFYKKGTDATLQKYESSKSKKNKFLDQNVEKLSFCIVLFRNDELPPLPRHGNTHL
jgi:hypothetical protein